MLQSAVVSQHLHSKKLRGCAVMSWGANAGSMAETTRCTRLGPLSRSWRCTMLPNTTHHTCWSSSLPLCFHGGAAGRQQLLTRWSDHRGTARRIQTDIRCSGNDLDGCQGHAATRRSLLAVAAGCTLLPLGSADASGLTLELSELPCLTHLVPLTMRLQLEPKADPHASGTGRALQGPANFLRERQRSNAGEFILSPIKVHGQSRKC
jgi:hypothetical protein